MATKRLNKKLGPTSNLLTKTLKRKKPKEQSTKPSNNSNNPNSNISKNSTVLTMHSETYSTSVILRETTAKEKSF